MHKYKFRCLLKKYFTPITIMLVPHSRSRSFSLEVPFIAIVLVLMMSCVGAGYLVSVSVQTAEYYQMKGKLSYFSSQYDELKTTMTSLKKSESEFRQLFALKSKKSVLESVDVDDTGSIDIDTLKKQIDASMQSVTEIKQYLSEQKNVYLATPSGWPVAGRITSGYGVREHPKYGKQMFHSGIDISIPQGTPVDVTADGIISFAGWADRGGNIVVVEHGYGFSTAYAHNSKINVKIGQMVKRGDVIAYSGSTGVSTGPHVHYEVWKSGQSINPVAYLRDHLN
jgi:murein DD-endopeptidase MepM/ murein hydrolase activator NlpD